MGADVFEIVWPAIFLGQEIRAFEELARSASLTLGRVRAVEVRNMAVPNVSEPAMRMRSQSLSQNLDLDVLPQQTHQ